MAAAGKPVFPMVKVGKTDLEFAAVEFNDCEFSALPWDRWIGSNWLPRFFQFLRVESFSTFRP